MEIVAMKLRFLKGYTKVELFVRFVTVNSNNLRFFIIFPSNMCSINQITKLIDT